MNTHPTLERSLRLGKLAGRLAADKIFSSPQNSDVKRQRLVQHLLELHGLPQKVGQIISLSSISQDKEKPSIPTEKSATLSHEEILALIERELGDKVSNHFQAIQPTGTSASIGQVHAAFLKNRRKVAVKVQYPGIADAVRADLKTLGWLTQPIGGLRPGFDMNAYHAEIGAMLAREIDYKQEAALVTKFGSLAAGWSAVKIPEIIPDLSTSRILTMTWMDGESLESALKWPDEEKKLISETMLQFFVKSFFEWKLLHGDPHPGNYRFIRNSGPIKLGILDFGCTHQMQEKDVAAIASLIQASIQGNNDVAHFNACYLALGFKEQLLSPMAHLLPRLTHALFEPFTVEGDYNLKDWNLDKKAAGILGEFRWNFRAAGPARLLGFVRTWQGLLQYLKAFNCPINWKKILDESLSKTSLNFTPQVVQATESHQPMQSTHLRISVVEKGESKVELTMKASSAEDLCDLVPPEIATKLAERKMNLSEMAKDLKEKNFTPGDIFKLSEGNKHIRVWLE